MRMEFINHQTKRIKKGNRMLPIVIIEIMITKPMAARIDRIVYLRDDWPLLLITDIFPSQRRNAHTRNNGIQYFKNSK